MGESIHLSRIYPCSRISIASELYYVCELGKYLSVSGHSLSLDGIILDTVLRQSKFWKYLRIALTNNWVCDAGVSNSELLVSRDSNMNFSDLVNILVTEEEVQFDAEEHKKRNEDVMFNILTPKRVQTFFQDKDKDTWSWSICGSNSREETVNSRGIRCTNMSQSFVSIIAYIAIRRFLTHKPDKFCLKFNQEAVNSLFSTSDVLLLESNSDALNAWFTYEWEVDEKTALQHGYKAWWYKGHETGLLSRTYLANEKYQNFLKLGMRVGSVISLYTREENSKGDFTKAIANHHYAIVRGISKSGVTLEVVHTSKTFFSGYLWFRNLTMAVKDLYREELPYKKFNSHTRKYDWMDIGVEYMMYDELEFVTPIYEGDSKVIQIYDEGRSFDKEVSGEDFIYWVLKDYKVDFDEELFLKTHFPDREPVYNLFKHDEVKLKR